MIMEYVQVMQCKQAARGRCSASVQPQMINKVEKFGSIRICPFCSSKVSFRHIRYLFEYVGQKSYPTGVNSG